MESGISQEIYKSQKILILMRLQKKADGVIFADEKWERAFESLSEEDWLKKSLRKAIEDLKENIFAGENISKKLIPKEYKKKYGVDNL